MGFLEDIVRQPLINWLLWGRALVVVAILKKWPLLSKKWRCREVAIVVWWPLMEVNSKLSINKDERLV